MMFRRFAKTEAYGYGWMDLGVGSFTFVAGLVSAEARKQERSLADNLSGCVPLLVLGVIRLIRSDSDLVTNVKLCTAV